MKMGEGGNDHADFDGGFPEQCSCFLSFSFLSRRIAGIFFGLFPEAAEKACVNHFLRGENYERNRIQA